MDLKNKNLHRSIFIVVLFTGVLLELLLFYLLPKQSWVDGLLQSWYFSQGLTIYKDSVSMYFPLLYALMVPFHKLFGFTQNPTIIISLVNSVILFTALTIFSFKNLQKWFCVFPPVIFLLWNFVLGNNQFTTPAFLNLVTFLSFACWWSWYKKPSKLQAILTGLFLSLTVFTVQIMALFVGVIFISLFLRQLASRKPLTLMVITVIAFLTPIIIIGLWLASKNALSDFYYRVFLYYFSPGGYPYTMGRSFENTLMFLTIFSPLILLIAGLGLSFKKKFNDIRVDFIYQRYIFSFLILVSFAVPFWFAIFHQSRFQSSLAVTSFLFGVGLKLVFDKGFRKVGNMVTIGLVIVLHLLSLKDVIIPYFQKNIAYPPSKRIMTEIYPDDPMYKAVEWIKKNTPQNAKLFATTDSLVYLKTKRLPINAYATSNLPVVYTPFDKFKQALSTTPPDYWVIDERQWDRFHDFGYDEASEILQKILACEEVVAQIEHITIRKHKQGKNLCI